MTTMLEIFSKIAKYYGLSIINIDIFISVYRDRQWYFTIYELIDLFCYIWKPSFVLYYMIPCS